MSERSHLKLEKNTSPRSGPVTERITEKTQENPVGNLIEPEAFQDEKKKESFRTRHHQPRKTTRSDRKI